MSKQMQLCLPSVRSLTPQTTWGRNDSKSNCEKERKRKQKQSSVTRLWNTIWTSNGIIVSIWKGKWKENNIYPRDIFAKFTYFKDLQYDPTPTPPQHLYKTDMWAYKDLPFPPKIEEKRKKLYSALRQAKTDLRKAKLVLDVLYISTRKYITLPMDPRLYIAVPPCNPHSRTTAP